MAYQPADDHCEKVPFGHLGKSGLQRPAVSLGLS